jgi:hypothetical protein
MSLNFEIMLAKTAMSTFEKLNAKYCVADLT